ncbi:MAG: Hpt domain-containing protein [Lachnospiraceae bacterium]
MDKMLKQLEEYGADTKGTMDRFLNDMELYRTCFTAYLEDEVFLKLGEALHRKDYENAFEYAHTLKGTTGNMGLTPLYQVICRMVEALRKKEYSNLQNDYTIVMEQLKQLEKYK